MFLNRLKKKEKVAFLELAHHVARSDGDFSKDEKTIIEMYCIELQIEDSGYDSNIFNLEKTLDQISSRESKKIVLMEIMALVYSDDTLDESEKEILNKVSLIFKINDTEATICKEWSKSILALYSQGQAIIEL